MILSITLRADEFEGTLEAHLTDPAGAVAAASPIAQVREGWHTISTVLLPTTDAMCRLRLVAHGDGVLDVDEVRLVPGDHWGAEDSRWSQGVLRRDLVEALFDLAPRFLRFPGGCIVEGASAGNHYRWKDSVGPLRARRSNFNLWGAHRPRGDYGQSLEVGFYEYFLLCEDLRAEPVPVVWAGMNCQFRSDDVVPFDAPAFDEVIQDTIDLIDWATADPGENPWAAMRAEAGHPEPFLLRFLAVGNENYGPDYLRRFERIKAAAEAHHPGLTVIMSAGPYPDGPAFEQAWMHAEGRPDLVVDEHYYRDPAWFRAAATRYDDYRRDGPRVAVGEYAAHVQRPGEPANTWVSALAEAVFLTGIVRNSDVVTMASYAPLLNLVGHGQWEHNLLEFDPRRVIPTANAEVQRLFATHIGSAVVPLEGLDGHEVAGLHAVATVDAGRCFVILVNPGDREVPLRLDFSCATHGLLSTELLHAAPGATNRLPFLGEPEVSVAPRRRLVAMQADCVNVELPPGSVLALAADLTG